MYEPVIELNPHLTKILNPKSKILNPKQLSNLILNPYPDPNPYPDSNPNPKPLIGAQALTLTLNLNLNILDLRHKPCTLNLGS